MSSAAVVRTAVLMTGRGFGVAINSSEVVMFSEGVMSALGVATNSSVVVMFSEDVTKSSAVVMKSSKVVVKFSEVVYGCS